MVGEVLHLFNSEGDEGKLPMPEGVRYTLEHHDEHGTIPVFLGASAVTAELNEMARTGVFEVPSPPRD